MGTHPLGTGNYVLIFVGIILIVLGPYIAYRAWKDVAARLEKGTMTSNQWLSQALNIVIALLFEFAGVLFVVNNLRGNPLA